MSCGWRHESTRHGLASKGIKTKRQEYKTLVKTAEKNIGKKFVSVPELKIIPRKEGKNINATEGFQLTEKARKTDKITEENVPNLVKKDKIKADIQYPRQNFIKDEDYKRCIVTLHELEENLLRQHGYDPDEAHEIANKNTKTYAKEAEIPMRQTHDGINVFE